MSLPSVNVLNMLLAVLSVVAAFLLPFEVFIFSYAILGPLHYLTQISWMHDRHYFTASRKYGDALCLLLLTVLATTFRYVASQLEAPDASSTSLAASLTPSITFVAFGIAALMIFVKEARMKWIGAAVLVGLSFPAQQWADFGLVFGGFLPTIVHVCLFTLCFVLVGALKSRDWSGIGLLGVYFVCATLCFLWTPETNYVVSEAARERYTSDFYGLNASLSLAFSRPIDNLTDMFASQRGLMLARFIAFSYTYHYLNWFSKTSVIRWHEVPRGRLVACVVIWIGSLALYAYDFRAGVAVLAFLSLLHVYLEFPLNHRTFVTIGSELSSLVRGRSGSAAQRP